MKLGTRHMALILSAAAIAAAGCGSSSSSKTTAAPTPATPSTPSTGTGTTTTAGGFSGQLEALCKQAKAAVTVSSASDLPKWGAEVEKLLPQLEALKPPAALMAEYQKFLATAKQQVTAAKNGDLATVQKLEKDSQGQGAKLGAPGCDA